MYNTALSSGTWDHASLPQGGLTQTCPSQSASHSKAFASFTPHQTPHSLKWSSLNAERNMDLTLLINNKI